MTLMLQLEIQITLFIQAMGEWLAPFMNAITMLGNEEFYMLVMPILYWCIDPGVGFRTGALLILSGSINSYFKLLFHSPRPYWVDTRVKAFSAESSFGLPSGHSMNAAAIWGWLGMQMKRRWAVIFSVVVIFLIGFSRLYLGVHFTRDVLLAGCLVPFSFSLLPGWKKQSVPGWHPGRLESSGWAIFVSSLVMIGLTFFRAGQFPAGRYRLSGFRMQLPPAVWRPIPYPSEAYSPWVVPGSGWLAVMPGCLNAAAFPPAGRIGSAFSAMLWVCLAF